MNEQWTETRLSAYVEARVESIETRLSDAEREIVFLRTELREATLATARQARRAAEAEALAADERARAERLAGGA